MASPVNKKSNLLIHESSPYLLQHANNPVDWHPFGEEAFELAREQNKPMLISIGYSACHWCHVMEHESFEDIEVAALMNANFINVKVDREERSDVDQLYMQAVQLMNGHGGWPLNCFVMPDGSPFYGGTYFPKPQWTNILQNLGQIWKEDPNKVKSYAQELTNGIHQSELLVTVKKEVGEISGELLKDSISRWKQRMDNEEGGPDKAPKFPLPSNYLFLLRYAKLEKDESLLKHVELTLKKMAFGGIYDQLEGGFCRYSTDKSWKVPHFEKMLYDNAQLAALYTEAFALTGNNLYKEIAQGVLHFVQQEWYREQGFFYSAFDADSDGEEGKYYVWRKEDLQDLLGRKFQFFAVYYHIDSTGYWEDDNYILMRRDDVAQSLLDLNLSLSELEQTVEDCRDILRQELKSRIKPGLDDKMISSWNAMMCSAYAKAGLVFNNPEYRAIAIKSAEFLRNKMCTDKWELWRTYKNGSARIPAFLEDYAFTIQAWIDVYLLSGEEKWLHDAKSLLEKSLHLFHNNGSPLLYYTAVNATSLVTRTSEIADNVCPASNSQMAHNLYQIALYFENPEWKNRAEDMLSRITTDLRAYGAAYSHWANLALYQVFPTREVAIVGNNVDEIMRELSGHGLINTIFAISRAESKLPLVKDRYVDGQTLIYVCQNNSCELPVTSVEAALKYFE
jgi:hypothetical protein